MFTSLRMIVCHRQTDGILRLAVLINSQNVMKWHERNGKHFGVSSVLHCREWSFIVLSGDTCFWVFLWGKLWA